MRKKLATALLLCFCLQPCRAIYSLSADRSVRLENLYGVEAHAPPQACRAGSRAFVILSDNSTYYLHAATSGAQASDLSPSWSCTLFPRPSAGVSCVDPGGEASAPAVFVVSGNATVQLSAAFPAPDRRLPGCDAVAQVVLAPLDWGNSSAWYPAENGLFLLYACGPASVLAFYSLYAARQSVPIAIAAAAPGEPAALDAAAFPSAGVCAAAFATGGGAYLVTGLPTITGADFNYGVTWGPAARAAVAGDVTSVAVLAPDVMACVVVSAGGNFSSALLVNVTSNETQLLHSGASGAGAGYWAVVAGAERPGASPGRSVLLHTGPALLRFEYSPGQGWSRASNLALALGSQPFSLAISRGSFALYPYMSLIAEASGPVSTTLDYYYGYEVTCADYKGLGAQCVAYGCTHCEDLGLCVSSSQCPVCGALSGEANCTKSSCLWCSELEYCSNPLIPCQLCRDQKPCPAPCVFCDSNQVCYNKDAVCTYCPDYTRDLALCRGSASCAVCNATQECLSLQDSCFDCHQYPVWESCRFDSRCGWCSYTQTCEGLHSALFNPASRDLCLCSDAADDGSCSGSPACYWDAGQAQCLPLRCTRRKPDNLAFVATILRTMFSDGSRETLPGTCVGAGADFSGHFYVASTSPQGPWIATVNSTPDYVCMNIFAEPTTNITAIVWDSGPNLYYVVGGGRNLPVETDKVPADVGFASAVKTEDCFIAAFNATNCAMYWAVPWGSAAEGEFFTDIVIADGYIAVAGIVGADFPVNGACAPEQTTGLSGIVLIYDRSWRLVSCQFCGTQMNRLSVVNDRLAALGVGQYSDRAKLLRYFSDSSTWLCDDIPMGGEVVEAKAVGIFQDPTDNYLVAMVPSVMIPAGPVSRLVVLEFYEINPAVVLEVDLLSSEPGRRVTLTGIQAVFASFLALDISGYTYNDTATYAILGEVKVSYNATSIMEVDNWVYQVWAPDEGGVSKFDRLSNFLSFIILTGSTTEDNFPSTAYVPHSPGHAPNPIVAMMARQDDDFACLPPLPVPPLWASAAAVIPALDVEAGVAWPSFNFSWDHSYFAFTNSYYYLRLGNGTRLLVSRDDTWKIAQLPFTFEETTVLWSIEAHTPYSQAATNSTLTYRVAPRRMPPDLLGLAASPAAGLATSVADAGGAGLLFSFANGTLAVNTAGGSADITLSTASFALNLTGDAWLVFAASGYVYTAQKADFWQRVSVRLTSYDGYAEWVASSAACEQRQLGDWQTFGVPLAAGAASPCRWNETTWPPSRRPDMRAVFAVTLSFRASGQIILLRVANLTTAATYAARYASSASSAPAAGKSGHALLGLLGLTGVAFVAAGALVAAALRCRRGGKGAAEAGVFELSAISASAPSFDPGEAALVKNLAEFPLVIPRRALCFGCHSKPAPIDKVIAETFVLRNATGKSSSGGLLEEAGGAPAPAGEASADRSKWSGPPSEKSGAASSQPKNSSAPRGASASKSSSSARSLARASGGATTGSSKSEAEEDDSQPRPVMPAAKYSWKIFPSCRPSYELQFEPDSGCLSAGGRVEVTAKLQVRCTTTLNVRIPIAICEGSTFAEPEMYAHLGIKLDTVMSTKIDPDELTLCQPPIGGGTYGTVFKGSWRGQDVAIKVLKNQQMMADEMASFQNEVDTMEKLKSPYIVNFLGACFIPGRISILTELCPLGNLFAVVKNRKDTFSPLLKVKVLLDCAKGMNVIHQASVIHRDLKPDNLLMVSFDPRAPVCCKISDMGTARMINKAAATQYYTKGMGTPVYMAPEILENSRYSPAADVYSFALVAYYVMTHIEPYSETCETGSGAGAASKSASGGGGAFATSWKIAEFVRSGKRLAIPEDIPSFAAELIRNCWAQEPHERPLFSEIALILAQAYESCGPDAEAKRRHHRHAREARDGEKYPDALEA
jgi:hypothetical protein